MAQRLNPNCKQKVNYAVTLPSAALFLVHDLILFGVITDLLRLCATKFVSAEKCTA